MQNEDKKKIKEIETKISDIVAEYSAELGILLGKKRKIIREIIQNAEKKKIEKLRDELNKITST